MPRLTNADIEKRPNLLFDHYKRGVTYNISGSRVRLTLIDRSHSPYAIDLLYSIRIEGVTDKALTIGWYSSKESVSDAVSAIGILFFRLQQLQPETWGNSKGVMSRGEIKLMRLAILIGGISVLTCLVWLLVILVK